MSDFKETCIWMSYRYAIGRKTIASLMHAEDIAKHMEGVLRSYYWGDKPVNAGVQNVDSL